ncbi:MAG: GntG family PLP-dependent aldolase [Saprospiraceae bacterium]
MSDTVTLPTKGMLEAMSNAKLGDDVFREDPTVIELEDKMAAIFGMEAGLYCPSGTMCNQIAIKMHTQPMDEMLCDIHSHVYQFEVGGYSFLSQIAVNPLQGNCGILSADIIKENIKDKRDWLPITKLVVLENSGNRSGGNCYSLQQLQEISQICRNENLNLHLDGARIFNALLAKKITANSIGPLFDSISICLSKGLGAPVGSVLIGKKKWIDECRRIRKVLGGGMRQVGILAAAGIYALDNNIDRLSEDHHRAKRIEQILMKQNYVESVIPVETNIVIFNLKNSILPAQFVDHLKTAGVNSSAFGKQSIRFVTHLDITEQMIDELEIILSSIVQ